MFTKNAPGKDLTAVQVFEVDVIFTLIDGSVRTQHVTLRALSREQAKQGLSQLLQQFAMHGFLNWDSAKEELVLDPAPSQIQSLRARLPALGIARAALSN